MRLLPAVIAVAMGLLPWATFAHNIQLGAHSRECFHEQLHKDDKMTVTFQVGDREFGGSGSLEIDFWVRKFLTITSRLCIECILLSLILTEVPQIQDPTGNNIFHERSVANGDHSFDAKHDGRYIYCFSNEHWSASTKEVSFNVHGIVYVPEHEAPSDPLEVEGGP